MCHPDWIGDLHQTPAPARIPVRWGMCAAEFDPAAGWLRSLTIGGREVVRAIYGAVRDRNWRTLPTRLHPLHVEQDEDGFRISFEAECIASGAAFRWQGAIAGGADGTLVFRFDGEALADFWRNRIGLCVLHPIKGCAGKRCQIETVEGTVMEAVFPRSIAPRQPFRRVRSITHEVARKTRIELRFEGDVFETEDQRNWTDASFKTYCTPLAEPFPVWIERGTRVAQSVSIRFLEPAPRDRASPSASHIPELRLADDVVRPLPSIGFGMTGHGTALTAHEAACLRRLRPGHLRVDLHLGGKSWRSRWRTAAKDSASTGAPLHVAVFVTADAARELEELAVEAAARPAAVALWLVFHEGEASTNARWVRMAEHSLPGGAPFATGTNANFAELNRARPAATESALPCYSMNPQVHAFDDASLIENLGAQAATVASARRFAPRPVVISPITLRPRFNAVATAEGSPVAGVLPPDVDVRQMSLFAAAWTTGSLARLAALDGVHSLTYFETTGWCGLMESAADSPMPGLFPSLPGQIFPVFHVFAMLAGAEGVLPTRSTHPLALDGFCVLCCDGSRHWVVANLTDTPRPIRVATGGSAASARLLDGTGAGSPTGGPEAFSSPRRYPTSSGILEIELNAYAIAQITVED